ncbi:hypothetical protein NKJ36_02520 [Mesorhizobium sp. M0142]|uniref:hypothetical protein n=1 Tax=unclassified Mesorhizobium TaxID=325217 RepID=UPI0003CF3896|nr:hypothetical protein X759_00820 [Mesorhizobium sp. LSHC420B00]
MSRSREDSVSTRADLTIDREIASLLAAIEQERVPDRLTKLAIELQHALVERRLRQTSN